jgi:hypothetical protein
MRARSLLKTLGSTHRVTVRIVASRSLTTAKIEVIPFSNGLGLSCRVYDPFRTAAVTQHEVLMTKLVTEAKDQLALRTPPKDRHLNTLWEEPTLDVL